MPGARPSPASGSRTTTATATRTRSPDRRRVQLQRLLDRPRAAQLHAQGLARLPAQPHLPEAVLEVREDVAGRLGGGGRARLPARVLPGAFRDEAQVRSPTAPDRALPD